MSDLERGIKNKLQLRINNNSLKELISVFLLINSLFLSFHFVQHVLQIRDFTLSSEAEMIPKKSKIRAGRRRKWSKPWLNFPKILSAQILESGATSNRKTILQSHHVALCGTHVKFGISRLYSFIQGFFIVLSFSAKEKIILLLI